MRPFEDDLLSQIKDYYRIGLTWTSNALEGNSLSESETKVLLEDGLTVGGRPLRDVFETVDHAKAYDYMFSLMQSRRNDEQAVLHMDYISLLERAYRDDHDFVEFIVERELESQKEILRLFEVHFPKLPAEPTGLDI